MIHYGEHFALKSVTSSQVKSPEWSPYSFGDKLVKTHTPVVLRCAGLHFYLSVRVGRLLEDFLRPDRFRVPLHGS